MSKQKPKRDLVIMNANGDPLEAIAKPRWCDVVSKGKHEVWYPPMVQVAEQTEYKMKLFSPGGDLVCETPWLRLSVKEADDLAQRMRGMYKMHMDKYLSGLLRESEVPKLAVHRRTCVEHDVSEYFGAEVPNDIRITTPF